MEAVEAVVAKFVLYAIMGQVMVVLEVAEVVRVELVERAVMEEALPLEFTSMLMALMEAWSIVSFKQET